MGSIDDLQLETPRLILRVPRVTDLDTWTGMMADEVTARFKRYALTREWQAHINRLQFGATMRLDDLFAEKSFSYPDLVYRNTQFLDLVGEPVELHHAMGETDDATWVWMPTRRLAMVGDLIVSSMQIGRASCRERV